MSNLLRIKNRTLAADEIKGIYFDELSESVDVYLIEGTPLFSDFKEVINSGNIEKFLENPELAPFEIFDDNEKSIGLFVMNLHCFVKNTFKVKLYKTNRRKTHLTFSVDGEEFYSIIKTKHFNMLQREMEKIGKQFIN